jgi:hypothetical protein
VRPTDGRNAQPVATTTRTAMIIRFLPRTPFFYRDV